MKSFIIFLLLIFTSVFLFCERIPPNNSFEAGELQKIKLTELNGIPGEFGPLFAVTAHGAYPDWAQLWFVDDQGTIRMVRVNFHEYRINEVTISIPRN